MNSEELEQSLRTEFDVYLKSVLTELKQDVSGLQNKIEAEFEKHKSQVDAMFQQFSMRLENDVTLDDGFRESVVEHLRLARDEGARITAEAITEAEQMREETAPAANFSEMRDAVSDITGRDSQAEILKALVNHAARYTPRGAFFIVKNDHFVGWRVFGTEANEDEQAVREVFFPVNASTILSKAVNSLETAEGSFGQFEDEAVYLNRLDFGRPDRMYAIPLVARGRGVAVLYADYGQEGTRVDIEALETLVRVAGLTVELLAAFRGAKPQSEAKPQTYVSQPPPVEKLYGESVSSPAAAVGAQNYSAEKTQAFSSYQEPAARQEDFYQQPPVEQEEYAPTADVRVESDSFQTTDSFQSAETSFPAEETNQFNFAYTPSVEEETPAGQTDTFEQNYQSEDAYQPERNFQSEQSFQEPQTNSFANDYSTSADFQDYSNSDIEIEESEPTAQNDYQSDYYDDSAAFNQPADETVEDYRTDFSTSQFSAPKEENSVYESLIVDNEFSSQTSASDYPVRTSDYEIESPTFESPEVPQFEDYSNQQTESAPVETPQFESNGSYNQPPVNDYSPGENTFETSSYQTEPPVSTPPPAPPVQPAAPSPVRTRFSERNTDLPIEVNDDERRLHNDARRFARLLVSEIKLYNEQKVNEGREAQDLYERLREAIDRSREMYDKRVQPPVASKFDYFHYELVNTLAEGDESRLGSNYPGAEV